MGDFKEKLKNIENISEDYAPLDPQIAQRAIERIKAREAENKETVAKAVKPRLSWWKTLALGASMCVVVFCCIFFPLYFNNSPEQPIYYSDEKLSIVSEQTQIEEKISNVNFCKFAESINYSVINQLYVDSENQKLCYYYQDLFDYTYGDTVNLYVELINNATFDFEKDYKNCNSKTQIANISVNYVVASGTENVVFAKFSYDSHNYFLKITTDINIDAVGRLDYYITLLLGD